MHGIPAIGLRYSIALAVLLGHALASGSGQQAPPPPPPPKPAKAPPPRPNAPKPAPPARPPAPPQARTAPPQPPAPGNQNRPAPQQARASAPNNVNRAPVSAPRTLPPAEAANLRNSLANRRAGLTGVNRAPLPNGQWTENPDRSLRLAGVNGSNYLLRPSGSILSYQRGNARALLDGSGHVQALQRPDLTINHGTLGEHRITARRPDGGTVVSYGPHHGYIDRPLVLQNHQYIQRVSVDNSQTSVSLYRPVRYGSTQLNVYVPDTYYGPRFYLWLNAPWSAPVQSQSSFSSSPAQTYYSGYYTPAPTYSSPDQWMTDYVISSNLKNAFSNAQAPSAAASALGMSEDLPVAAAPVSAPITPQIKAAMTAQVGQVVADEKMQALHPGANPAQAPLHQDLPAALDPALKIFFVSTTLQVLTGSDQCRLTQGDVLYLAAPAANGAMNADLVVKSTLKGDCPAEAHVVVSIPDLQEMNNHFRENIASAEQTLAANDPQTGLPLAPDATPRAVLQAANLSPDQAAATGVEVDQLQQRASREEASMQQEITSAGNSQ